MIKILFWYVFVGTVFFSLSITAGAQVKYSDSSKKQIKPAPLTTTLNPAKNKPRLQIGKTTVEEPPRKSPLRRVFPNDLPDPETNSYDLTLNKSCGAVNTPCCVTGMNIINIPGAILSHFKNVNPEVSLWFPYTFATPSDAPSTANGFIADPGDTIDPIVINSLNFPMTENFSVTAIPLCKQNNQYSYCPYDIVYIRTHYTILGE